MATTTAVTIRECTDPIELYRHYDGQSEPQPAYIALDLEDARMWATYNAEIGNAVPFDVFHGIERRYGIPLLTAQAANRVMEELRPLAERILADSTVDWDGNNNVATLGADAQAAENEIAERLGNVFNPGPVDAYFDTDDVIAVWDIDGAVNGDEAEEYGITAATTDERLDEIAADILSNLASCGEGSTVVCEGLDAHLRGLRDEMLRQDKEVYWSVMRGPSPDAYAVQPEPAGIAIPETVLEWATGHGLSMDDPDVYLVVAPQEGATDMDGEIDCMEGELTDTEAVAMRTALDAKDADEDH
ncbi:hypothetical protein [Actinacidiphila acididurans]|uniref:Uncharacterized protein n=1 Tax=Actinacidiphila acididurans TaxID=2784346 RepID=A0ABS2U380_9ACTN|nr:hypothetical protein [Actinacidiphila acididurans]MBM9510058.1 hypothetical protein [Actinacidiphila acididurans]